MKMEKFIDDIKRAIGNRQDRDSVHKFALAMFELVQSPAAENVPTKRDQVKRLEKLRAAIAIVRLEIDSKVALSILVGAAAQTDGSGQGVFTNPYPRFKRLSEELAAIDDAAQVALKDTNAGATFAKERAGRPTKRGLARAARVALIWNGIFTKYPGVGREGPFARVLRVIFEEPVSGDYALVTKNAIALAKIIQSDRCKNSHK